MEGEGKAKTRKKSKKNPWINKRIEKKVPRVNLFTGDKEDKTIFDKDITKYYLE